MEGKCVFIPIMGCHPSHVADGWDATVKALKGERGVSIAGSRGRTKDKSQEDAFVSSSYIRAHGYDSRSFHCV